MPRLGDYRGAGQPERELGAASGALGVGPGDWTSERVLEDSGEVRSLAESVRESDRKIV